MGVIEIIGSILVGVIALLGGALKITSTNKKKVEAELSQVKQVVKSAEKTIEVKDAVEQAKVEVDSASDNDVLDGLQQYNRSRNKN